MLDKRNGKLGVEGHKKRKRRIKKLISLGSGSKNGGLASPRASAAGAVFSPASYTRASNELYDPFNLVGWPFILL